MVALDEAKRAAALAAVDILPATAIVGLGTGSTAKFFVEEVGRRVAGGARWVGVPTSLATRKLADSLGIPMLDDEGPWEIDVTVDGADEVSEALDLIKGGGGAQTREKIVNFASKVNIIVVDETKLSHRLGEKWPIPVEILRFGHRETTRKLGAFGTVTVRDKPTDADNLIADVSTGPIDDPGPMDRSIRAIPGVVETGLFVSRAERVIVAGPSGIRTLRRP